MYLGQRLNTSLGEVFLLEENKYGNYLILFTGDKFVKANKYYELNDLIVWEGGEYYNSLVDLMSALVNHSEFMEKSIEK